MKYKTVLFDFDSTLVTIEGINELARFKGIYDSVSRMTDSAMGGSLDFEDIFYARLKAIKPTAVDLMRLSEIYTRHVTEGAKELIHTLILEGTQVYVVSGGYEQAILPTTTLLGIKPENMYAIALKPDHEGFYTQVARNQMLIKRVGKQQIIQGINPLRKSVFVGDGATDIVAKAAVDTFIGYGGVVSRQAVKQQADLFIDQPSLMSIYNLIT